MRFEAKNQSGKRTSKNTTCRINICKTIAIKNQLVMNHRFLSKCSKNSIVSFGSFSEKIVSSLSDGQRECLKLRGIEENNIQCLDFILFYSKKVTPKRMFAVTDGNGDEQLFKIDIIFRYKGDIYFLTQKFLKYFFIDHFQAYRFDDGNYKYELMKNAVYFKSFRLGNKHRGDDGNIYCTIHP